MVKDFIKNQESCVLDGGATIKYIMLKRGACQGDPIPAFLFN